MAVADEIRKWAARTTNAAMRAETREIPILDDDYQEVPLVSRGTGVNVVRPYKVKGYTEMPLGFLLITRLPLDLHALGLSVWFVFCFFFKCEEIYWHPLITRLLAFNLLPPTPKNI